MERHTTHTSINLRGNGGFDGFRLSSSAQTIKGISITSFNNGVELRASSRGAVLHCNYIGLMPNGASSGNNYAGVRILGEGARVGGTSTGNGNVISGNGSDGVLTENGSTDTAIRGNFIGTDPAGMVALANGNAINHLNGTATWRDITYNLISGNGTGITPNTDDRIGPSNGVIRIQRNHIGVNRLASNVLRNGWDAIFFDAGSISMS